MVDFAVGIKMNDQSAKKFFNRTHAVAGFECLGSVFGVLVWTSLGTGGFDVRHPSAIDAAFALAFFACCIAASGVARRFAPGVSAALGASVLGSAILSIVWINVGMNDRSTSPAAFGTAVSFGLISIAATVAYRRFFLKEA